MRKAVGLNSYHSGQAQHLEEWKQEQLAKDKIAYLPISKPKKTLWQKIKALLNSPTVQILIFLAIFCSAIGAVGKGGF